MSAHDLRDLVARPEAALDLPPGEARALLVALTALTKALELAAAAPGPEHRNGHDPAPGSNVDRLLTADEAAQRLGLTMKALYRRSGAFPFTRRLGARTIRFSERAMKEWLATGVRSSRARGAA